jgi:Cft2 family RNA processing exonuclease
MQFTALGGAAEVGASCMLLQIAGKNILLDAGIRVNRRGDESLPDLNKLEELIGDDLHLVLISHAHLDHTGALPLILKRYPTVKVYCTLPTKRILEILLEDTVRIMEQEVEEDKSEAPLYNREMVERVIWILQDAPFSQWFQPIEGVEVYFHPAGHVMGAACIFIKTAEGTVAYSGDIATVAQRTVSGMESADFFQPDLLILESTYGDSIHANRKTEEQRLAQAIAKVIERGGTVLVPSFAFGRAQEIILILKGSILSGVIPKFPIFVDGMVRAICDAYTDLIEYLPEKLRNWMKNSQQLLFWNRPSKNLPEVTKLVPTERIMMFNPQPKCIISSSGMLTGGPSVYYARVLAAGPQNAIFLTGYQDEESPGRKLLELQTGDPLVLEDKEITVECEVNKYNLSAHADQIQLCQQVSYMNPKTVILVHGEWDAIQTLRRKLMLKHIVQIAQNGETIEPTKQPEWISDYTLQKIEAEQLTFYGTLKTDDDGITFRFDKTLLNSAQWKQFFEGYTEVKAKFMGKWLHVRGLGPDEGPDE